MASLRFTTLVGGECPSNLIEVSLGPDQKPVAILLDCGWDEPFNVESLDPIIRVLERIDAVLISHADMSHIGALTYLITKHGLKAPVYSTLPVRRMGEMFLTEMIHAKQAVGDFDLFSLDDVRHTFWDHPWVQLRYSQHLQIKEGNLKGLALTPFNAGRSVGGSIWRLTLHDGSEVLYALDWCHKKERHLNGALVSDQLSNRPALMVAGAFGCLWPSVKADRRDEGLLELIITTLRGDGCVLLPVDAAGRVLELLLLLEGFWSQENAGVLERAQQQIEWMSDHVCATFGTKRDNPFELHCVKTMTSLEQLSHLPAGPKVVLAWGPSLECGFARDLFLDWSSDERNTICFTERAQEGTLAKRLQSHVRGPQFLELHLERRSRVPLQGKELEAYMRAQGQVAVELNEDGDEDGADGDDPMDAEIEGQLIREGILSDGPMLSPTASATPLGDLMALRSASLTSSMSLSLRNGSLLDANGLARIQEDDVLIDGFEQPEGAAFAMFPDEDEPMLEPWDAYGRVSGLPDLTPAGLLATQRSLESTGIASAAAIEAAAAAAIAASAAAAEEEAEEVPEIPTKIVVTSIELTVRAAIRFFDYGAQADSAILHKALEDVAPRHLVLPRGTAAEREEIARLARHTLRDFGTVVAITDPRPDVPLEGEQQPEDVPRGDAASEPTADAAAASSSTYPHQCTVPLPPTFTVFLSDELNARLGLGRMQRYALAQLEATIGRPDPHHPSMLQLLPSSAEPSREDVFIADSLNGIQLSHIKKALSDSGLDSSFQGAGLLVCGPVAIRKGSHDKAHLVLEGAMCDEFFRIREVIYSQYSVC